MIGQSISHYRVIGLLGQGGMGVVYEAEDVQLGRRVALKFLPRELAADPQALQRFQREARAASSLTHPCICTIYAIEQHEAEWFIAMELLQGESLAQRIAQRALPMEELLPIAIQIAEALEVAHGKGVVHRDIKPANIFVAERRQVKVLDFGLAKLELARAGGGLQETAASAAELTQPGSAIGTVSYMSPEQARGQATDPRTDLFSFGAVLYQMATGALPFQGETSAVVFEAILNRDPVPPVLLNPNIVPEIQRIMAKAMEKDRSLRYQTATELKTDLLRLKRDLEAASRPISDSDRKPAAPAAAKTMEKSVAVLYFENLSGAKEDEYFRDGMTEDIITELSKIKGLKVFPRPTVLPFRDKPATATQVGQQLGAAYVLGGTLRRAGNRLRINAQLMDARTDFPVWSERFDRQMEDVFEVQDEMARKIAEALRITLSSQEKKAIEHKPTENAQAYDFYLRGRSYGRRVTRQDLDFAIQMFERAIALDDKFTAAYAGLGLVCGLYHEFHARGDQAWIARAQEACARAMALQPDLPEAMVAQAHDFYVQHKYKEAIEYARRAVALKPDVEGGYWCLGQAYFCSQQWEEAAAITDTAVEAAGDDYNVFIPFMNVLEGMGRVEQSNQLRALQMKVIRQHLDNVPEDVRARILLANSFAFLRKEQDAVAELKTAVALRPKDVNILYNAACTYALLGRKQDALALLKRSSEAGFLNPSWAAKDPDLLCLHDEPEFQALLAKEATE